MPAVKADSSTPHTRESSFVSLLSGWMQQGIDSFLATQRILVDLAMRQNESAMDILRGRMGTFEFCPIEAVTQLAAESTANFIEAQKLLLHLAQEENEIVMTGVKEQVGSSNAAHAMTDAVRRSLDTFLEMQEGFLRIASKQTNTWLDSLKNGKTPDTEGLVELARDGMDTLVRFQKKFLDVIAEEASNATSGKTATRKTHKGLPELARQATSAFIDSQKKLLDVAGRQANVGVKAVNHAVELITPFQFPHLPEMTREGVKSFVDAEKALIDTVVTRSGASKRYTGTTGRGRRPARPIKMRAAKATA
jgi:hypothetical protein